MPRPIPPDAEELTNYSNSVPPPPYPGDSSYDLTPMPQSVNRPRLPEDRRNPHLRHRMDPASAALTTVTEDVRIVKFQTIVRDGREIIIGRIKVPTGPNTSQHAFILRRYDTNAISLTTMYKVAFPRASEEDEKREMDWVRSSYDTRDTNGTGRGSGAVRLAGQWVSRQLAIHLAPAYGLADLVHALARAAPDPNVSYRKSQRSQAASDEIARQRTGPASATSTPARPAPSIERADPEAAAPTPKRAKRTADSPIPEEGTPSSSSRRLTVEATTTVTAPAGSLNMDAEIESAKQLVRDLKRELQLRHAAGDELEETGTAQAEGGRGTKRVADDDSGVAISGGNKADKRVIRTNKRVEHAAGGTAKRVAFGALLFGLGAGAAMIVPQLAANFF